MNDLKLVIPDNNDKKSALLMLDEIKAVDAGLPWQYSGLANLEEATSYEDWVKEKANEKNGIDLRDGYVPCTTLFLKRLSDNKICGSISIRHELNEFLLNFASTSSLFISKISAILVAISSFLSLSTLFGTAVTIFTDTL